MMCVYVYVTAWLIEKKTLSNKEALHVHGLYYTTRIEHWIVR